MRERARGIRAHRARLGVLVLPALLLANVTTIPVVSQDSASGVASLARQLRPWGGRVGTDTSANTMNKPFVTRLTLWLQPARVTWLPLRHHSGMHRSRSGRKRQSCSRCETISSGYLTLGGLISIPAV